MELCQCAISNDIKIGHIRCRNAISPSKIPGVKYCLNPYVGCEHGCIYCYAVFMKRFTEHSEEWGKFVDTKLGFVKRLSVQLGETKPGTLMLGTVTDAYQPLEAEMKLTRRCLELLAGRDLEVHIQTKSDLVLRDLDLLKKIKNCWVGFTITTPDQEMARQFEPRACEVSRRLKALRILNRNQIRTFAFVGPILPAFSDNAESLRELFRELKLTGTDKIYIDRMHYWGDRWMRIRSFVENHHPQFLDYYQWSRNNYRQYSDKLKDIIRRSLIGMDLDCEVVF